MPRIEYHIDEWLFIFFIMAPCNIHCDATVFFEVRKRVEEMIVRLSYLLYTSVIRPNTTFSSGTLKSVWHGCFAIIANDFHTRCRAPWSRRSPLKRAIRPQGTLFEECPLTAFPERPATSTRSGLAYILTCLKLNFRKYPAIHTHYS